jgi:hypothetical protein
MVFLLAGTVLLESRLVPVLLLPLVLIWVVVISVQARTTPVKVTVLRMRSFVLVI